MKKRILSIVLTLLMTLNVFTIAVFAESEADNNAAWKLTCENTQPNAGDTIEVKLHLKADYVTNSFGAMVVYDKNYYEPAETTEANNFVIASDYIDYGNKSVVISSMKSANQQKQLYSAASYTDEQKEQYSLAWFSFTFQSSKFSGDVPTFPDYTHVASLKLKVKEDAKSDGNGLIWMDPAFQQTAISKLKYTFVARGSSSQIEKCIIAAKFGQTITFTDAVLFKPEEVVCSHTNTTLINVVEATCTSAGYTGDTYCNDCQETIEYGSATAIADHTPGNWVVTVPSTCTVEGTQVQKCAVCETVIDTNKLPLASENHTEGEWEVTVPATCTTDGTKEQKCAECMTVINTETIPATGHTEGKWEVTIPATTTTEGTKVLKCAVCGEVLKTETIPVIAVEKADYAAVEAALAKVPADLTIYTETTVKALEDAIDSVVYDLTADKQAQVNAYAAAIEDAINALELIPATLADYTELNNYIDRFVPAGSNLTNGVYDAEEISEIYDLINSFDLQVALEDQAIVDGYLASLKAAVAALTIDESKAVAEFEISTDADDVKKDDIVTVSVKLKTNYPIYTMQVPVIYDTTVFEVVTENSVVPKSYLTFTGSLADMYKLDGNSNPASSMYKRNSNTSYWSTQTQYKVAYITWTYDVSINSTPVTLDEQETIATFKLKVISDTDDTTGSIFMNSDWIKTATCRGGALAVGRTPGKVISVLDGAKFEIGQTIDLTKATATLTVNTTHVCEAGDWEYDEQADKFVQKCSGCGEVLATKDLPIATINSTENVGNITEGDVTVIKVTADDIVSKIRLVNAAGSTVSTSITADGNDYTISKVFGYTGKEVTYKVQYKVADKWFDFENGEITVNVKKLVVASGAVTSVENDGEIVTGTATTIKVATSGEVQKVRLINAAGNVVSATITSDNGVYTITKTFSLGTNATYKVQYKSGTAWYDCENGSFSVKVVKAEASATATVTAIENDGEVVTGTTTTITVATSGEVQKVRIVNVAGNEVSATITSANGVYTITKTFALNTNSTYKVQYKVNGAWKDAANGSFSIKVVKPEPGAVVTVTDNVGNIKAGTPTKLTVTTVGEVQKVRVVNANGVEVSTTITSSNGVYTIAKTFANGTNATYKVQYKANGVWKDAYNGSFTINNVSAATATVTAGDNVGDVEAGSPTVLTVTTTGDIQKVRIVNAAGNEVSSTITSANGIYTITKTFARGTNATYKVQFKANNVWSDCTDGEFQICVK